MTKLFLHNNLIKTKMDIINTNILSEEDDILNTAFIEDNSIIIDHERSYIKFNDFFCCYHRINEEKAEKILSDLDEGSWILWDNSNEKTNCITIKLKDGYIHHTDFIYNIFDDKYKVYVLVPNIFKILNKDEVDDQKFDYIGSIKIQNEKKYVQKVYKNYYDFLIHLNKIYGLDINKQVIYEND